MTGSKEISGMRRLSASFEGTVQGVGFRFTTVEIARNHEIAGYVQNLMDGSVKVVAEGAESELLNFLRELREAHIYRYVTREDLHWLTTSGEFEGFVIRYA
ncbi:MAG TPA: acylphosphatase [Kiritimatiellia bacterium]|nr:acylphosphatase [Kiritimatiellia bacterium]